MTFLLENLHISFGNRRLDVYLPLGRLFSLVRMEIIVFILDKSWILAVEYIATDLGLQCFKAVSCHRLLLLLPRLLLFKHSKVCHDFFCHLFPR
jgi:hypothetical protein